MHEAILRFTPLSQRLGLVINERKTKFMCRAKTRQELHINSQSIERVTSYKYFGVCIGYTAESKEAEINYLKTQCCARLRALKVLAWHGRGVGVPVLRTLYISTVRSLFEYASPALSCYGNGRLDKLEKIQNQAEVYIEIY